MTVDTPCPTKRISSSSPRRCRRTDRSVSRAPSREWAHGRAAPFRRNDELLDLLPRGILAYPGSGITENPVDRARRLGTPVQHCQR